MRSRRRLRTLRYNSADMPSNILALLFAAVMAGLTMMNRAREIPPPAQTPIVVSSPAAVRPRPTPIPSPSPSVLPSPSVEVRASSAPSPLPKETLPPPAVSARAYALADSRGQILAERNGGAFLPIASLTKLMTAVVFAERFPEDGTLAISETALALNQNSYGLSAGDTLTKQEALEFMLVASSNIVAQSAAEAFGEREFLQWMNGKALELGMADTLFIDASGLGDFSRSSAKDIVKLLRYLTAAHPELLAISRSPGVEFRKGTSRAVTLLNTNELTGRVAGILGGKTGYTDAAGGCLALVFEWRGRTYYAVVLGSKDRFADMRALVEYAWNL